LTVVVSVYNEEAVLNQFWNETSSCLKELNVGVEFIFVNDGSSDGSLSILKDLASHYPFVKVINFSRNFGHEAAMIAGIDAASGDAVVVMDADLQHPPQMIKEMLDAFSNGFEIITMTRIDNLGASWLNRFFSRSFYVLINRISSAKLVPNASDFFLISGRIAAILKNDYREKIRFTRGIIQTMGFKSTSLRFTSPRRRAGSSKYSFIKYLNISLKAITSFSSLPLHLGVLLGGLIGIMSIMMGIFSIIVKLMGHTLPGYTTIVVLISFLIAVQLFITGLIGEYIGFMFDEVKNRPIYIIDQVINDACNDFSEDVSK
jgi:glycosyltransferase involved in cell wall biosynthesis